MNNIVKKLINKKINFHYDFEKVKNKTNTSKYLKKTESCNRIMVAWKKWVSVALSVLVVPLVVLILQPWNSIDNPNSGKNPFNSMGIYYDQNAVAIAAVKTMDSGKAMPMTTPLFRETIYPLNTIYPMSEIYVGEDGYIKVTYPFTGVRIDYAYEFYVTVPKKTNDFVTMNCGDGTLRVIVANFTLFEGIWPALSDEVILVVIGEKGMLHCLGGGGIGGVDFSMHKFLSGANVEKDLKYEGYGFCLEVKDQYSSEFDLKVVDKDNGTTIYRFIEKSYAMSEGGILYDITEIILPFIDVIVISVPEDYENSKKRFLVNYQTTDENGDSAEQELTIIITDETYFEGISINEIASDKNIRIEFKDNFTIIDTKWMLTAIRIIEIN